MEPSAPPNRKRDISSEWLHALVESALDGVITMDDKGRIIAFNPAAEKIFGYRSDQVIGHRVSDMLIPGPLRNAHEKGLAQFLAISRTVEIKDPYTAGHQRRVAHLAATMAQALKLPEERIEGIFLGALLHDIGKIAVPSEILSRPGKLREEDMAYIKIHCRKGYEILNPVDFPWPVAEIALQHHEHMDGSGYPQGLPHGSPDRLCCRCGGILDRPSSLPSGPSHGRGPGIHRPWGGKMVRQPNRSGLLSPFSHKICAQP